MKAEMSSSANYKQRETRENESEPCAETSASDSENLAESSGCPSPDLQDRIKEHLVMLP